MYCSLYYAPALEVANHISVMFEKSVKTFDEMQEYLRYITSQILNSALSLKKKELALCENTRLL